MTPCPGDRHGLAMSASSTTSSLLAAIVLLLASPLLSCGTDKNASQTDAAKVDTHSDDGEPKADVGDVETEADVASVPDLPEPKDTLQPTDSAATDGVQTEDSALPDSPSADDGETPLEDVIVDAAVPDEGQPPDDDGATDVQPPPDDGVAPTELTPWVQCENNAPCKELFGDAGWCNLDFPGGQCWGCADGSQGDALCTQLGQDGLTLTCKEGMGLCLFDCPCPSWLKCANGVCILKGCTTDADCAPLTCRSMSEGGSSYCLPPV